MRHGKDGRSYGDENCEDLRLEARGPSLCLGSGTSSVTCLHMKLKAEPDDFADLL